MILKLKILTVGILLCLPVQFCLAQAPPFSDQFLTNSFLTNPAITGTSRQAPLTVSIRQQWMGIKSAPVYQTISYHKSLIEKGKRFNYRGFLNRGENSYGKIGIGGGLFNFKYGSVTQMGLHLDYAYHVYLKKGRVSFGLAPLYQQFAINTGNFIRPDGNILDNLLDPAAREVTHFFDAAAGVHYSSGKWFAGLSGVELFNSKVRFGSIQLDPAGDASQNYFLARTFYAYGGITPMIGKNFTIKPSVILKYSQPAGIGIQANILVSYNDNIEAGFLYRYKESYGFFLGLKAMNVLIRYQFETPAGSTAGSRFLTNQILVGYLL